EHAMSPRERSDAGARNYLLEHARREAVEQVERRDGEGTLRIVHVHAVSLLFKSGQVKLYSSRHRVADPHACSLKVCASATFGNARRHNDRWSGDSKKWTISLSLARFM